MSAPGHNRARARSTKRRAAAGKPAKPTPQQLRAIAGATTPRNPGSRILNITPRSAHRYDDVLHCRNAVRRSGVVPYLNERLHTHVGSKCRFDAEALLTGMLLTAYIANGAMRTEVTRTIATMDARQRFELNFYDPNDGHQPPSYRTVHKQMKRLEDALRAGWVASDGTRCDEAWFTAAILRGTIPKRRLAQATAIAIDGTAVEAWARTRYFGGKKETDTSGKTPLYVDSHARYQRASSDDPTLQEPRPRKTRNGEAIGDFGPDGRRIVSLDSEARAGWKTATGSEKGKYYVGYEAHLAVMVREATWQGNPDHIEIGEEVPNYVVGVNVTSSGTNRGIAGVELVDRVSGIAPNINEVLADRGYTMVRSDRFLRPLHERNINVVMDYPKLMTARADRVVVAQGSHTENMWSTVGTFLHLSIPTKDRTIKKDPRVLDPKLRVEAHKAHGTRARTYRWSEKERLDGGAIRFKCPLCAGRAVNVDLNPDTEFLPVNVTPVRTPPGATRCCSGTIKIDVDRLDHYQRIPWGTAAWTKSYGRRTNIEGTNGRLRNELGLDHGVIRSFGTIATMVMMTLLCAALNLRIALNDDLAEDDERGRAEFSPGEDVADPGAGESPDEPDPPPGT